MNFFYKTALEPTYSLQLADLFNICFPASDFPDSLSADADGIWIAEDETRKLAGCLLLFQTGIHSWEGIPLVHPAYRRQGIFSSLLAHACKKGSFPGEDELLFSVRPEQTKWRQVLTAIEAEKVSEEYMMEYSFGRLPSLPATAQAFASAELTVSFQGTEGKAFSPHVSCLLSSQGNSVYLYQLLTKEEFRRQGRASAFLHHLFPRLKALGFSSVRLQVSGENLPAMALYKKTGFHITETLSFYLY